MNFAQESRSVPREAAKVRNVDGYGGVERSSHAGSWREKVTAPSGGTSERRRAGRGAGGGFARRSIEASARVGAGLMGGRRIPGLQKASSCRLKWVEDLKVWILGRGHYDGKVWRATYTSARLYLPAHQTAVKQSTTGRDGKAQT